MNEKPQILIIDDEPVARRTMKSLLLREGYDLAFAGDGPEALAKAAELTPNVILLDVMMPGMDGFEVCRRLRADPLLAESSVIMVTALDDRDSRLRGLEAGANDFVSKPFDRVELRARVRAIASLNHSRRLRARELQAERDRTRSILEALGEAVVVTGLEGTIQYINPAAAALTGYSSEEALGQSQDLWQSDLQHAEVYNHAQESTRAGQTWRGEVVNKRKDGTLYDAELTIAPLFDPHGDTPDQPVGFVSVQRDVTPLKEAERLKDRFVSNVSHELRTPLSVITFISGNLDMLYDRLDDGKRRDMIRDLRMHAQVLNDLIGDVLDISRIDGERISLERQRVNLAQLARMEVDEQLPLAEKKSQTLRVTGAEQLDVWADKGQLRQVLRNLLNNAIKFTHDGGQIVCDCAPGNLALETEWPGSANLPDGRWAALRVTDSGIGIGPEELPHLFERFYRVKTQGNIPGTGLGLSIARELTELHGGRVAVASTPGEGSIFAIYLPLLEEG